MAIDQAEQFIIHHPGEAQEIALRNPNISEDDVTRMWSHNQFSITLDLSLIAAMEDESRWMIDNGLIIDNQIPNFSDYIYEDALVGVKPEAVNIIR